MQEYEHWMCYGFNEAQKVRLLISVCVYIHYFSINLYMIDKLYFSLTVLNMAWCSLDSECMTLLCKTLPSSILRLNLAGCRKTMTDDSEYE